MARLSLLGTLVKAIQKNEEKETNVLNMTDSLSAIQGLEDNRISVYKNNYTLEVRRRYFEHRKRNKKRIVIAWLPGHEGVKRNEIADSLAKAGIKETAIRELKVPYNDLKEEYKNEAWINTQESNRKEGEWKGKNILKCSGRKRLLNPGTEEGTTTEALVQ